MQHAFAQQDMRSMSANAKSGASRRASARKALAILGKRHAASVCLFVLSTILVILVSLNVVLLALALISLVLVTSELTNRIPETSYTAC